MAAGYQVVPVGMAAAGAGNHVIECQFGRSQHTSAELARGAVAKQNILAGKRARLKWNTPEFAQANDRGHAVCGSRGMYVTPVFLFRGSDALKDQDHGAADRRDVDRFVGCIQYEHRSLQ